MPAPWRVVLTGDAWADLPRLPPAAIAEVTQFLLDLEWNARPRGHEVASSEGLLRATVAGCRIIWTDPELTGVVEVARLYPPATT